MSPSLSTSKQNPMMLHEKSRSPLSSGNGQMTHMTHMTPCDRSTATNSTGDLSCTSLNSSYNSKQSPTSSSNSPTITASKSLRSLNAPVNLHSQQSLLDATIDESHDDDADASVDHGISTTPQKNRSMHSLDKSNRNEITADSTLADSSDYDLGSSIMEQTEKNLAAISESMSGSFCVQGAEINNSCTMPDCGDFRSDPTNKNGLFSDSVVQSRLLDDFNYLLGSDVMPCCEEKNIFSSCFGSSSNNHADNFMTDEPNKIRNRAGESWRARAYRVRRLREESMMKNGDDFEYPLLGRRHHHQLSMDCTLRKSHSADGRIDNSTPLRVHSQSAWHRNSMRPKHEVQSDPLGRIIGDCIDPISPVTDDAVELEVVWKNQDTDLCYDSDPGETSYRKSLANKKKMHRNQKTPSRFESHKNSNSIEVEDTSEHTNRRKSTNRYSSLDKGYDEDHNLGDHGSFDVHLSFEHEPDEDEISIESIEDSDPHSWHSGTPNFHQVKKKAQFEEISIAENVQNALNRTWTLTWHPVNETTSKERKAKMTLLKTLSSCTPNILEEKVKSPRCIRLWFERGNRIRGNNIVEPKLMWRDAYHPELSSHRKLNDSITKGPNQICLLSICRILEVTDHVDRTKYPFAKKTCSFLIRTCDEEEFLFETQSEKERSELVYLWKLVVARLASQAVVGDGDKMVGEFFVPSTFGVP